jgi:NAD(P)-dependent dehydrogenase (short-subunit alcohol dehydrogenase family)
MTDKSQFESGTAPPVINKIFPLLLTSTGHKVPVTQQSFPGKEGKMPNPTPLFDEIPTFDGKSQKYKAAGKLQDRKAIITGGDSGIGRATAILFAMEGADTLIAYLPEEEDDAQETKKRVEAYGRKCHLLSTDLRDCVNCKEVVDEAVKAFGGRIDILFNNAAFQNMVDDISKLSEEQWLNTFNTNIHPYFYLAKYALPHMKPGSTIINNASINAYTGRPDLLDYTSTKGAIVSFTRGLSNQQVGKGIRVNAVAPGPVWTPLIPSTMPAEKAAKFGGDTPLGRPGQPAELAPAYVFLASNDATYITGAVLPITGGRPML